jgi:hypothetical protein
MRDFAGLRGWRARRDISFRASTSVHVASCGGTADQLQKQRRGDPPEGKAGVVAYTVSGDRGTGDYDNAQVLFKAGRAPPEFEE